MILDKSLATSSRHKAGVSRYLLINLPPHSSAARTSTLVEKERQGYEQLALNTRTLPTTMWVGVANSRALR
jgi:hypothetical protein